MFTLQTAQSWIGNMAESAHEHAHQLTELDAAIGDADHGANLDRGFAACATLDETFSSPAAYLKKVGMTLVSKVGGASGPLYGTFFLRFAASLGDATEASTADLAAALRAGVAGIAQRGKSTVGEKTMLDALTPAVDALEAASGDLSDALSVAGKAASEGREATRDLVATKGRASYLGERSKGHIDPGAASAVLLLEALAKALA